MSGVGVYVSKCIGPLTLSSLFIPQTATHSVIIYEAIAKVMCLLIHRITLTLSFSQYHIHFSLGLYLHSPHSHSATGDKDRHSATSDKDSHSATSDKDILVPLFKVCIIIILKMMSTIIIDYVDVQHSGGSLSLEELQVAYKHLKETIMDRNKHQMDFR